MFFQALPLDSYRGRARVFSGLVIEGAPDCDEVVVKIEIVDPQREAFFQPEAGVVEGCIDVRRRS